MGLLQTAFRTYEGQADKIGVVKENREPLVPVAHMITNSQIEIALSQDGVFRSAQKVEKGDSKIIIPVTVESANRTSDTTKQPHPLSDQLQFLTPLYQKRFSCYMENLKKWNDSAFSHPKLSAILTYLQGGTILSDLAGEGVIVLDESGKPKKDEKSVVRWRVASPQGIEATCWTDNTLFEKYTAYYMEQCKDVEKDICLVSGKEDMVCQTHPKGVVSASYGAKLISANDSSGFTYRGRFTEANQAYSIGYTASQKAHNALHWIAANQGVIIGGRTFLCWNPNGQEVPQSLFFHSEKDKTAPNFAEYQKEIRLTLGGYGQKLQDEDVVIACLEAATTGRLSVTYYNEIKGSDFLERLNHWYETVCWQSRYGVQSPALRQIVNCAFGNERANFIEADEGLLREHTQRLLICALEKQPIPMDIVRALAARANNPLGYKKAGNRERLLSTACAVIRSYRNNQLNREEWTLTLDKTNTNRSYLWGRLLAIAEKIERDTYGEEEGREPNAIRMQTVFSQRPAYAWRIIYESLLPYLRRHTPGLRAYYHNLIDEVSAMFEADDYAQNKRLEDVYLFGYSHQRNALYQKKEKAIDKEENE